VLALLMGVIYKIHRSDESDGMIHVPSFMKNSTGLLEILRFGLTNLRGCNVGITVVGSL
jgi:hypothetical protein